jgi:hypothetical protein
MPDRRAPSKSAREVASRSERNWADIACRAPPSCDRPSHAAAPGQAIRCPADPVPAGQDLCAASSTASSAVRARHPHLDPTPLPKFEHHDARHEPTLIAAARSQMTASSPRGTFSQAELTADRVITRCITPSGVGTLGSSGLGRLSGRIALLNMVGGTVTICPGVAGAGRLRASAGVSR